jgi:DNA polymerase elongation subunit (family B)
MKQFHLLDVLAHDFEVTNEDETTIQGHFTEFYNEDSEGEVVEEDDLPKRTYQPLRHELYIELFGVDTEGIPIHLKVTGFRPYFYIGLQKDSDKTILKEYISKRVGQHHAKDLSFEVVQKGLLFGYTARRTFPLLKISTPSLKLFRKVKDLFLDKKLKPCCKLPGRSKPVEVYEANLDPMLRFFHLQNLEPCGWIQAETEFEKDERTGRYIGECDWTQVIPPKIKPGNVGQYLLAAWDIECYSPNANEFPVPEKKECAIIQIGVVLVRPGQEPERHIFVNHTCDPIEGAIIHAQPKEDEKSMLLDWAGWMCERDPDLLVGYNVFGFDERYVWKRAELLGISHTPAFQMLSRHENQEVKLQESNLSSSALGDNKLFIWLTPGRLHIDLLHYIRRLEALPSYKLDDVTSHYMSGKLKKIRQENGLLYLKTAITKEASVGRSVKLLDDTGEAITEKCMIEKIENDEIVLRPDEPVDNYVSAVKWAVVKDDVSPQEIFKLHRGNAKDRARLAKYCIQDCNLVVELFNKLDVFNNAMSMANVCSVPIKYIFTRGQGIKIESLIFKECHQRGQAIKVLEAPTRNSFVKPQDDDDDSDDEKEAEESYEGAIVFDPKPDFYFDAPVGVCDFASLYPSSIISENISYDTLLWVKDFDLEGNLVKKESCGDETIIEPNVRWTDIEFDIWGVKEGDTRKNPDKEKKGLRVCRYAQLPDNKKGTLPDILQKLLSARKSKRKEAEKEADPFRKALLDAEQLAYKLTANSLYGQLGSATFKIRLQHLAASTTAYGRKQITFAKNAIERFYGPAAGRTDCCAEIVYGDTDSLFVSFNPRGPDGKRLEGREALVRTIQLTEQAGKFVSQTLKAPHDFEYDKVFWPFIIFSKKRYVGNKYEESPDEFKQTSMGIVLKRRDNAPIVKTIYGGAIHILLNQRDVPAAWNFVSQKCMDLLDNKVSLGQLTITKSLKANYKNPTKIAHKVLADRIAKRDPGNAPASGDRIPYVFVEKPNSVTLQGDRIELPSYVRSEGLKPDIEHYIHKQLSNPLSQLFSLRVENIPGFTPPFKGWPENEKKCQVARERVAADLLFGKALKEIDRKKRVEALKRFGFTYSTQTPAPSETPVEQPPPVVANSIHYPTQSRQRTITITTAPTQMKQLTIDSMVSDDILIKTLKQKKQKQTKEKPNGTNRK